MDPAPTALALVPPAVALAVAAATRRVTVALGAATLAGATLLAAPTAGWLAPVAGAVDVVRSGVLGQVAVASQAQVLVLIVLIGAFVHLLETSGAGAALMAGLARRVRDARRAELVTWLAGVSFFFSDIGHVLIVGPMFRPLFDRVGLARERLAWIVDTTAAPLSVVIPVAAWGVYVTGLFEAAFAGADPAAVERVLPGRWDAAAGTVDGFGVWRDVLPFQLYAWLSLLFVPLLLAAGRPYGPMVHARPVAPSGAEAGPALPASAGALPVATLFGVLFAVGGAQIAAQGKLDGAAVRTSLACAYLAATGALAAALRRVAPGLDLSAALRAGVGRTAPIVAILVLAWALGDVCTRLGTGPYLARVLADDLPAPALAPTVFALGAVMSFATGTSWGTFAILVPVVVPLSLALGVPAPIALGAVLSGGVFGDHCSPISDTTLLASLGADTDHASHVATQLPYALTVGLAALVGFAVAGATGSPGSVAAGAAVVVAAVAASRLTGGSRGPRAARTP